MNLDAKVDNEIFRKDFPIILALNRHLAKITPVRLAHDTDGYPAGQCLARNQSTGYFEKFSAVSGGSIDSHCILFESIDGEQFTGSTGTAVGRGLVAADVYEDNCTDLDATFKTAIGGRTIVNNGDNILSF